MSNRLCILMIIVSIFCAYKSYKDIPRFCEISSEPVVFSGTAVKPETTGTLTEICESIGTYELTAYCPCARCCGNTRGITSTGTKATAGRTIAVDPKKIPYGTKVIIGGHTYVAEDCGGAIKGNRIDIFCNSHAEAIAFGRQYAEVKIKR